MKEKLRRRCVELVETSETIVDLEIFLSIPKGCHWVSVKLCHPFGIISGLGFKTRIITSLRDCMLQKASK